MSNILDVAELFSMYKNTTISDRIAACDDMYAAGAEGAMDHYMRVGRSAVDLIVSALVSAEKSEVRTVLDLPCGGGRVTRHLRALFPKAKIWVGDLDQDKQDFVAKEFSAEISRPNHDFNAPPERLFDLIFVGSLLTHFDQQMFERALQWFIRALERSGLLIVTVHGRTHDHMQRNGHEWIAPDLWVKAHQQWRASGYGFVSYPNSETYGLSVVSPSRIMRLVEDDSRVRIVGFREAGWSNHHDAVILQKSSP